MRKLKLFSVIKKLKEEVRRREDLENELQKGFEKESSLQQQRADEKDKLNEEKETLEQDRIKAETSLKDVEEENFKLKESISVLEGEIKEL